jgi:hypothetical protein
MDEFELIRGFRDSEATPNPVARAAARDWLESLIDEESKPDPQHYGPHPESSREGDHAARPVNGRGASVRHTSAVREWLAWLGGADPELLRDVPSASSRFAQVAVVLLTTAAWAVVSMTLALHNLLRVPGVPAAAGGLLWGFLILNLNRFLVISLERTRGLRRLAVVALPRLAMAAVIALVIATPLVLQVFRGDIRGELQREAKARDAQIQRNAVAVEGRIAENRSILAGHRPSAVTSPTLEAARTRARVAADDASLTRKIRDRAYEAWQCELYGAQCRQSSGHAGIGPLARVKAHGYHVAQTAYLRAQKRLFAARRLFYAVEVKVSRRGAAARRQLENRARKELPKLEGERADLRMTIDGSATGSTTQTDDAGILAQLKTLSRLSQRNNATGLAYPAVEMMFVLIGMLPVLVQVLLMLGSRSTYEVAAQGREEVTRKRLKLRVSEAERVEEARSNTRVMLEAHMRERERAIAERANDRIAAEMLELVETALHEWSEKARQQLLDHAQTARFARPAQPVAHAGTDNDDDSQESSASGCGGATPDFDRRHHLGQSEDL